MGKLFLGTREITPAISSTKVESLNINPTTSSQVITPTGDIDAFNPINVAAVTAAIDGNIQAGNIRKGITILGVEGNLGSGGVILKREVSNQGVYQMPTSSFTFSLPSNVIDVDSLGLRYAFYGCTGLISVDLSGLTTISGSSALDDAFSSCTGLTSVNLSSLTTISGNKALQFAFRGCTSLTSVSFPSLTTISGSSALYDAFYDCTNLTSVDLSGLTTISGSSALDYAFQSCKNLASVDLSALTIISDRGLRYAFYNCTSLTSLSFPSLTSTSFGSYTNQFNNMLYTVTGCTVHFPSNLESVIGSWSDVTAGFRGTNTTVLYDLPATS